MTRDRLLAQPWGLSTPFQAPLLIPRVYRHLPVSVHEGAETGYPIRISNLRPNQNMKSWVREQCGFYGPISGIHMNSPPSSTIFVFFYHLDDVS